MVTSYPESPVLPSLHCYDGKERCCVVRCLPGRGFRGLLIPKGSKGHSYITEGRPTKNIMEVYFLQGIKTKKGKSKLAPLFLFTVTGITYISGCFLSWILLNYSI